MSRVVSLRRQLSLMMVAVALLPALAMLISAGLFYRAGASSALPERAQVAASQLQGLLERSAGQLAEALELAQRSGDLQHNIRAGEALPTLPGGYQAALFDSAGGLLWSSDGWMGPEFFAGLSGNGDATAYWYAAGRLYQLYRRPWLDVPDRVLVVGREVAPGLLENVLAAAGLQAELRVGERPLARFPAVGGAAAMAESALGVSLSLPSALAGDTALQLEFHGGDRSLGYAWLLALGVVILAPLLALLVARRQASRLAAPLAALTRQLQVFASGREIGSLRARSDTEEVLGLSYAFDNLLRLLRRREKNLRYRATHDLLTGMKNQNELLRIVSQRINDARSHDRPFHLVGINISNFREISDVFGPDVADACLVNIGAYLEREQLVAARFYRGGIAVIKEGVADDVAAVVLAMQLSRHHGISKFDIELNVCTGIVGFPDDGAENADTLLRRLEISLDSARRAPYNFHRYKLGQEEDYLKRLSLVEELRVAMIDWHAGLQMYYQPKLNLRSGRVERMEALIRWRHPRRGDIPPESFISLAEQSGLISQLSNWVIAQVCIQLSAWRERGVDLQVAVNLSVQDLVRPDMLDIIEQHRQKYDLPAEALAFEITETELMGNPAEALRLLKKFRAAGYGLAIDDFGTGYSSLSQVKNMPVNEIKIDRDFVRRLRSDDDDQKIVRTTLALASYFDLEAVAEGVEDAASLQLLVEWGCHWVQGFYIAPPMPSVEVLEWLEAFHDDAVSPAPQVAEGLSG